MPEKIGHSVDGIEEYDNPIPNWLMWIFYVTILFSIVYLVIYPGFWPGTSGWSTDRMYNDEMVQAEAKYAAMRPKTVDVRAYLADPHELEEGKHIFAQNCSPCHGAEGKGDTGIGPNLTDAEWIYGGTPEAIQKTITEGTAKGMPAWDSQLGAKKVAEVAAFVHSLGGGQ